MRSGLYPPGLDASIREGEAELRCPECANVWWSDCTEHLGAMDIAEESCPECGHDDPELLGVE